MKTILFPAMVAVGALAFISAAQSADWPDRPVEISCFASAGGGTDTVDRAIARAMEPFLGTKINVVNRTGGQGGVALSYAWEKPHDGYTWTGVSEGFLTLCVHGAHPTTTKDYNFFMVGGAPDVISVAANSPYKTLEDLVAAAKANPGTLKAAASEAGALHHSKLMALEKGADIKFKFLPFPGSHPSEVAAMSGEVDVVVTSVAEQAELLKAGKLRPLAVLESEPYDFPKLGTIPSAADKYPGVGKLPVKQWLGFIVPKDTPANVMKKIDAAFDKAMASPDIKKLAQDRFYNLYGYSGAKALELAAGMEKAWAWTLYDLGVAKTSPTECGIAKP